MSIPIKSKVEIFADVLHRGKFIIPRYQRPYAWDRNDVKLLLDDIADCIATKQSHHFMGTIMLVPNEKNQLEINDGQQRISTFMLICAHLCKFFYEKGYAVGEHCAMHLLFDITANHPHTLDHADTLFPRVVLSTNDKITFQTLICGQSVKKNGGMIMAWKTIDDFFADKKYENIAARKVFFNFILNNLLVAWIEFKDSIDAISVFETLNTKGKPLEQIQLTCAYFFSRLRNNEVGSETIHQGIERIRTCLGNEEGQFFKYARYSLQCKYGFLSNERFCRDLKNAVSDAKEGSSDVVVLALVNDLALNYKIEVFQTLIRKRSGEDFFEKLTRDARQSNSRRKIMDYLKDLHKYGSVSHSILFALLVRYAEHEKHSNPRQRKDVAQFVYKSSKLLSSFFQRAAHSFPGSFNTSQYEQGVANIAKSISQGDCITAASFLDALKKLDKRNDIIPDSAYKERMKNISFSKTTEAKYILARISEYQQPGFYVVDQQHITKHILPYSKVFAAQWGFTEDEHGLYATRLGNLTLLAPEDNRSDADNNAKFSIKKKFYAKSPIPLTNELRDYKKWNKDTIEQRQAKLAEIAAEVWNFKI